MACSKKPIACNKLGSVCRDQANCPLVYSAYASGSCVYGAFRADSGAAQRTESDCATLAAMASCTSKIVVKF